MKTKTAQTKVTAQLPPTAFQRGKAAARIMAKNLRIEHKRWNMPLLSWKDGKVISTKP